MTRQNYTATARRDGKWWFIEVTEVDGAFTQVKRLDHAEAMAREVVALLLNVPEESFDITVAPDLGDEANLLLQRVAEARAALARAEAQSKAATRQAATTLTHDFGLTVRDAGDLLGVSFQRVAQLTSVD